MRKLSLLTAVLALTQVTYSNSAIAIDAADIITTIVKLSSNSTTMQEYFCRKSSTLTGVVSVRALEGEFCALPPIAALAEIMCVGENPGKDKNSLLGKPQAFKQFKSTKNEDDEKVVTGSRCHVYALKALELSKNENDEKVIVEKAREVLAQSLRDAYKRAETALDKSLIFLCNNRPLLPAMLAEHLNCEHEKKAAEEEMGKAEKTESEKHD